MKLLKNNSMMNIVCEHWDICKNKSKEKCYQCLYNDYLNIEKDYHDYNFEEDTNENWLELEPVEFGEEFDRNEYL